MNKPEHTDGLVTESLREALEDNKLNDFKRIVETERPDLNAAPEGEPTLLMDAAAMHSAEFCAYILDKGGDINVRDESGCNALHYVNDDLFNSKYQREHYGEGFGDPFAVKKLLISRGIDINRADENGVTPLLALGLAFTEKFEDSEPEIAPLGQDLLEQVRFYVEHGAEIDRKDKEGNSLLALMVRCGQHDIVEFLLEKGAKTAGVDFAQGEFLTSKAESYRRIMAQLLEKGLYTRKEGVLVRTVSPKLSKNQKNNIGLVVGMLIALAAIAVAIIFGK